MHFMTGMDHRTVRANGIRINLWAGGQGPPVLLLHGYPQTGQMWRKVAPKLLEQLHRGVPGLARLRRFRQAARRLRQEDHGARHARGDDGAGAHESYAVVGHDRGGRVAHRLALDYPQAVTRLCVLDIVPTHTVFARTDRHLAAAYWHWFYFQAPDLPELMISAVPEAVSAHMFRALTFRADAIEEPMVQEYLRAFTLPGTIRAGLEDYRAAATRDFEDDERDLGSECAVRCLPFGGSSARCTRCST